MGDPVNGVVGAHNEHPGTVISVLEVSHERPVHDDDGIAGFYETSRGTVDLDDPAASLAAEDIGFKPVATTAVGDRNSVIDTHAAGFKEILIDRNRADIVRFGAGNGGPMNLAVEDFAEHAVFPARARPACGEMKILCVGRVEEEVCGT